MRAAIYTRISQDATGQRAGVARQLEDCEALADRLGWEVTHRYGDDDQSAHPGPTRHGFEALLKAMADNEFGAAIQTAATTSSIGWPGPRRSAPTKRFSSWRRRCSAPVSTAGSARSARISCGRW